MNKEPCKVLVVDYERAKADTNVALLQLWGHEAAAAYSAEDAIAKATSFDPDVILVDMKEPTGSGFDLARELRARCPAAKLVALAGFTRADIARRTGDAGFEHVLKKPAKAAALEEAVDTACAAAAND